MQEMKSKREQMRASFLNKKIAFQKAQELLEKHDADYKRYYEEREAQRTRFSHHREPYSGDRFASARSDR